MRLRSFLAMNDTPIALAKAALRRSAGAARAAAHADSAAAAEALARHGMVLLGERGFHSVAGYWPMRDEIDPRPLLLALADTGRDVALPAVTAPGEALEFRCWRPGEALVAGPFGTAQPGPQARTVEPDVLLVPLLAYDHRHYRLGYGAGFYDRTLAGLRARKRVLAIGVAYSAQRVAEVPVDGWDEALDLVLTEHGIV
jgi:5-formyltetrahydrofolate cyclo-ligase